MHPYPKILGAHRNTISAVWYDRCVTKCAVVKGLRRIPSIRDRVTSLAIADREMLKTGKENSFGNKLAFCFFKIFCFVGKNSPLNPTFNSISCEMRNNLLLKLNFFFFFGKYLQILDILDYFDSILLVSFLIFIISILIN